MRRKFADWLEARTGYSAVMEEALYEVIPGGARWRYVFGSALTGVFAIQVFTGLLLMTSYVPSSAHAWGSVWYINSEMTLGWLIRGIHHFGSSAMIVLLGLHLLQVLIAGAYRRPREINWWLGMALMFLVIGFGLTGYLLPWDQKGYWATKVATNIAGGTPRVGPYIQTLLVGGSEYGNQTLTRFYALHVGVLPILTIIFIAAHVAMFRKHGVTHPKNPQGSETFWPRQVFMDVVASLMVLGVIVGLVLVEGGANLDAPADPASKDYPARPEWYFLSLFQLLQYPAFAGENEVLGTVVVPGAIVTVLFLMPLIDRVLPRGIGHFVACSFVFAIVGAAAFLTVEAVLADRDSRPFIAARLEADRARQRALQLADAEGIPPDGAAYVLQRDPYYHGMNVLRGKCLGCHYYGGQGKVDTIYADVDPARRAEVDAPGWAGLDGLPEAAVRALAVVAPGNFRPEGVERPSEGAGRSAYRVVGATDQGERIEAEVEPDGSSVALTTHSAQTAADLMGFGTREWLRGLLEDPSSPTYFGNVPQCSGMAQWKRSSKLSGEQLDEVADFFEEHVIPYREGLSAATWELPFAEADEPPPGYEHFMNECANCHLWGLGGADSTGIDSPNLYGWGSMTWTRRMIEEPGARDLYGYLEAHEQMPAFEGQLTETDLEAVIRLLKGDFLPPEAPSGPTPVTPPPDVIEAEAVAGAN